MVGDFLKKEALDLDRNVSIDIHRLIRIPTTLHGGTGLLCKEVKNVENFDVSQSVVFGDEEVKIEVVGEVPRFYLGDYFGPYNGIVKVPLFVAVFLVGKEKARFL